MNKQFLQFIVFLLMCLTLPLNTTAQKMYWLDEESNKIQRASLDGSNIEDLVTTELETPEAIALDVAGGKMYWTDKGTTKIQRANLDGSNVEDLITGLTIPEGIALDVARGKMYWVGEDMDKIQRANLNGSNIEALVTTGNPWGITLDLIGSKMYWTDQETDKIQRANLDGSNIEDLVTDADGLDEPEDVAVDIIGGKVYWVDHGTDKVQRANLDGSNIEDLVIIEGESRLSSIALDILRPEVENWAKLSFPVIFPVYVGVPFTLDLRIENVTDLAGWQADIAFNPAVLSAVSVTEGNFLSKDGGSTFFQEGSINNTAGEIIGLIAARTTSDGVSGTGVLFSITFEAQATGKDSLRFRNVKLGRSNREVMPYNIVINPIIVQSSLDVNADDQVDLLDLTLVAQNFGQTNSQADINNDGTVDIIDLIAVAQNLGESATGDAPGIGLVHTVSLETIQTWIDMAHAADDGSLAFQLGIANLQRLLAAIRPETTALLANYPNPFNPETWIPYQLAHDTSVTLTIYGIRGAVVRRLDLGHQTAGYYADRIKAAYWDGRNNLGESVGSGVYFYQLQTEGFSAIRKMVILK